MATKNNELEMFSFDEIKDEFIGEISCLVSTKK